LLFVFATHNRSALEHIYWSHVPFLSVRSRFHCCLPIIHCGRRHSSFLWNGSLCQSDFSIGLFSSVFLFAVGCGRSDPFLNLLGLRTLILLWLDSYSHSCVRKASSCWMIRCIENRFIIEWLFHITLEIHFLQKRFSIWNRFQLKWLNTLITHLNWYVIST